MLNIKTSYLNHQNAEKATKLLENYDFDAMLILDQIYYQMPVRELKKIEKQYTNHIKDSMLILMSNNGTLLPEHW